MEVSLREICWAKQLPAVATRAVGAIAKRGNTTGSNRCGSIIETDRRQNW
jgi:hypothetical protein